jgi:hypothetical protein
MYIALYGNLCDLTVHSKNSDTGIVRMRQTYMSVGGAKAPPARTDRYFSAIDMPLRESGEAYTEVEGEPVSPGTLTTESNRLDSKFP